MYECEECGVELNEDEDEICTACRTDWDYDDDCDYRIDGVGFADPGGRSALRAETADNPRIFPCPTCGAKNVLTKIDVQRGYQCNRCADLAERGY